MRSILSSPQANHQRPPLDPARYAKEARRRGLYVCNADGGEVPIPPVLEPTIVDLTDKSAAVHRLLSAASRAADRLDLDALGALSPFEKACLEARRRSGVPRRLATARVDFIGGKVLEINATIPAMQGYADLVVEALIAALGAAPALLDENGRNTDDLLRALLELAPSARTVGILARQRDAQRGELLHYVSRFGALGVRARLGTPEELRLLPDGGLTLSGERIDLLYRHLFSWRMDPSSDLGRAFLHAERHGIVNPIALDLEAKATLAELSRGADAAESWLTAEERALVQRLVPWTRRLDRDTAELAAREPARYVLKRSWDYGGKGVYLGIDTPASRWSELLQKAQRPEDVWIVQELVDAPTLPRTLAQPDGEPAQVAAYVDLCAFTNLGLSSTPSGGASRVAPRRVVNILGGGGLAPILRPQVARALGYC